MPAKSPSHTTRKPGQSASQAAPSKEKPSITLGSELALKPKSCRYSSPKNCLPDWPQARTLHDNQIPASLESYRCVSGYFSCPSPLPKPVLLHLHTPPVLAATPSLLCTRPCHMAACVCASVCFPTPQVPVPSGEAALVGMLSLSKHGWHVQYFGSHIIMLISPPRFSSLQKLSGPFKYR